MSRIMIEDFLLQKDGFVGILFAGFSWQVFWVSCVFLVREFANFYLKV